MPEQLKQIAKKVIEPGVRSPGTTLVTLLPAIAFIIADLRQQENLADADWQTIAMWVVIAAAGWVARSHNVSSRAAGVEGDSTNQNQEQQT